LLFSLVFIEQPRADPHQIDLPQQQFDRNQPSRAELRKRPVTEPLGFLNTPVPGLWIDRYDANLEPIMDDAPASSLYHIVCALRELIRWRRPA
jgi:mannose/cellobiose epimerase-like protein (N-acyl-D-glucosamine 2-epimerase family)